MRPYRKISGNPISAAYILSVAIDQADCSPHKDELDELKCGSKNDKVQDRLDAEFGGRGEYHDAPYRQPHKQAELDSPKNRLATAHMPDEKWVKVSEYDRLKENRCHTERHDWRTDT